MRDRRVLITGAGGFVGTWLARGFADLGWEVTGLERAFDASPSDPRVREIRCDLAAGVPDEARAAGVPDLVVHAAWLTTDPASLGMTPSEYRRANLRPLDAALRFGLEAEAAAFVFIGSSGVFGPVDGTSGLADTDEPTGASPYAKAKREGERLVLDGGDGGGTARHVVRLGYLYGPGEVARPSRQRVSLVARWLAAARAGRPLEVRADDPVRDWTFAPDLAAALERVVDAPASPRPVHLGGPYVYRDSDVAATIAAEFPGAEVAELPAGDPVKPPMTPSDLPALRGVAWTELREGVRRILEREERPRMEEACP